MLKKALFIYFIDIVQYYSLFCLQDCTVHNTVMCTALQALSAKMADTCLAIWCEIQCSSGDLYLSYICLKEIFEAGKCL